MTEKKFKEFLRMLETDTIQHLIVFGDYLQIDYEREGIEYDSTFECNVLKVSISNYDTKYQQWLSEVKKERGL